ncbi:hypothetical protein BG015_002480 [Linnemannia schmuckeri]|uniref:F-box domain-containing protein n=1 Tax=Linnemannia schmuckeri TaxID=64567 RepID=A0A9P5V693_9FUNG|nr:hypothetical protein BG015_002480 [Linnemannia schmuckeri]
MTLIATPPTTPTTTAIPTKHPLLLPEVLSVIGSFLDPPSLFSSVQVCNTWYHTLLPLLWESIDDSLYSWPALLKQQHYNTDHPVTNNNKDNSWLREVYTKPGHMIRHLVIHWIPTLNAAGISNNCNRLQSLIIRNKLVTLSPTDEAHQKQAIAWSEFEKVRVQEERSQLLPDEFLLLPEFNAALRPSIVWWTTDEGREQDWITGQRFWMLVLQNPGLRATLAGLRELTSLENNIYSQHIEHLLARNPTLTSFRASVAFTNVTLSTTFPGMRSLAVDSGLKSRDFFLMLHHLPNLENLECGTIGLFDGVFCPDADKIMEGRPSKLQRLSFQNAIRVDTPIANNVFQWIPHLKEINIKKRVLTAIASALVIRCQELEVFRQQDDTEPINLLQNVREQRNFLLPILQGCPRLRVFDAIHHRIDVKLLIENPFACEEGLETFRCQVVGLERLYIDKASCMDKIIELTSTGRGESGGVTTTAEKMDEALQELQIKVFEQLGRFTRLTTLDLGYAWRHPNSANQGRSRFYKGADGKDCVRYEDPIRGTLDLTLETGLDRLSTLTRLEVFGFEGVDFRLGKPELEWMAVNWPQLKVLRGLQRDDSLPWIEADVNKAELRRYMQKLRPEVRHEGQILRMGA